MTAASKDELVIIYILKRLGCTHPFYVSRIAFLADSKSLEEHGRRLTELTYRGASYGFYIEELPQIIEKLEEKGCIERHEEKGCIKYTCSEPEVEDKVRRLLDEIIGRAGSLPPRELNTLTLKSRSYDILVEKD